MKDNKARFRRMMDARRKAGKLYAPADQSEKFQAQMDFYKSVSDSDKKK